LGLILVSNFGLFDQKFLLGGKDVGFANANSDIMAKQKEE
jgi:hypothetical protein